MYASVRMLWRLLIIIKTARSFLKIKKKENANYSMNINFFHARTTEQKKNETETSVGIIKPFWKAQRCKLFIDEWIKQTPVKSAREKTHTVWIVWKILFCLKTKYWMTSQKKKHITPNICTFFMEKKRNRQFSSHILLTRDYITILFFSVYFQCYFLSFSRIQCVFSVRCFTRRTVILSVRFTGVQFHLNRKSFSGSVFFFKSAFRFITTIQLFNISI